MWYLMTELILLTPFIDDGLNLIVLNPITNSKHLKISVELNHYT